MPTMGSTPRFAKDRVIQASHPFRSARADVSSHPFYDSPGPPTRSWPDVTPRPRTAPQTKERPPPVEVPHTPAAHGYAGESPYAAIEVGTFTVDPHTNRLQILPDTALAKEMNGRLEVARQALVYARREGNMRSMREAADEFLRAERDQTSHVINAHRTLAHDLAFAEAERWRLQAAAPVPVPGHGPDPGHGPGPGPHPAPDPAPDPGPGPGPGPGPDPDHWP